MKARDVLFGRERPFLRHVVAVASLIFSLTGSATSSRSATISAFGTSDGGGWIEIDGLLTLSDVSEFRNKAAGFRKATVAFDSNGGNVVAGIQIGEMLRLKGFDTDVGGTCASACALAWLGGIRRFMSANAQIGFHAAYNLKNGQESGVGNALVGAYLSRIGLPDSVIIYITLTPPDSIKWLNMRDAKSIGIDVQRFQSNDHNREHIAAEVAYNRRDYPMAVRIWRRLADAGDANAQCDLGQAYEDGKGVEPNVETALSLYKQSANQGDLGCMFALYTMYFQGRGVKKDYILAHMWLALLDTQIETGSHFEASDAFVEWLRKDNPSSVELVEAKMTRAQIAEAQRLAKEWRQAHPGK